MKTSFRKIKDTFVMMSASSDGMDDPYAFSSTSNSNGSGGQISSALSGHIDSLVDSGLIAKRLNDIKTPEFNSELSTAAGKVWFSSVIDDVNDDHYGSSFSDLHRDNSDISSSYKQSDEIGLIKNKRRREYDTHAAIRYQEDKMLFVGVNSASLIDLVTTTTIMSFYHMSITHVALSRNGHLAFTGGHGKLRVWNASTGNRVIKISSLYDGSNPISVSPNQDHFLVGNKLRSLPQRIYVDEKGFYVRDTSAYSSNTFNADSLLNQDFLSNGNDEDVNSRIQGLSDYYDILMIEFDLQISSTLFASNGNIKFNIDEDVIYLQGHTDIINCIKHASFGGWAISGSRDGTAKVWDLAKESCIQTFSFSFEPIESKVYEGITESYLGDMQKMDTKTEKLIYPVDLVDISSDGRIVMAASINVGLARVWNAEDGSCISSFSCSPLQIFDISLALDGMFCAISLSNNLVHIHSLRRKNEFEETGAFVTCFPGKFMARITSNSATLLSVAGDKSLTYYKIPLFLYSVIKEPDVLPSYLLPPKDDLFVEED